MPHCHLLPYNIYDGRKNMEIDKKMASWCNTGASSTLLRFYGWSSPTLSIGYAQKLNGSIDINYCKNNNIDIIKRPTGGMAVLHNKEIAYCISSSCDKGIFSKDILESYKSINTAIVSGLRRLGVGAELYKKKEKKSERSPVCFASFAPYEILVNGKKIVGSAQRRFKNRALQHGSILIEIDREKLCNIFTGKGTAGDGVVFERMTSLKEEWSKHCSSSEIAEKIIQGFQEVFDFQFTE